MKKILTGALLLALTTSIHAGKLFEDAFEGITEYLAQTEKAALETRKAILTPAQLEEVLAQLETDLLTGSEKALPTIFDRLTKLATTNPNEAKAFLSSLGGKLDMLDARLVEKMVRTDAAVLTEHATTLAQALRIPAAKQEAFAQLFVQGLKDSAASLATGGAEEALATLEEESSSMLGFITDPQFLVIAPIVIPAIAAVTLVGVGSVAAMSSK